MNDDQERGLYQKYKVERMNDPSGKHADCPFFVLDIRHDPYARIALVAYTEACRATYPQLANDLVAMLGWEDEHRWQKMAGLL